jgi:hypothetical protein
MRLVPARLARSTTPVLAGVTGLVDVDVPGSVARYAPDGVADAMTEGAMELVASKSVVDVTVLKVESPECEESAGIEVSRYAIVEGTKVDLDVAVSRYAEGGSADVPGVDVSR